MSGLLVTQNVANTATSATMTYTAGPKSMVIGDTVTVSGHTGNAANLAMNQAFTVAAVTSATVVQLTGTGMTAGTYNQGTIVADVVQSNADDSAVANGDKSGCSGCAAEKGGPNVFLDGLNGCQWCDGCPKGQSKTSCASAACDVCSVGFYRDISYVGINTDAIKGVNWDAPCIPCAPCDAGKYRNGGRCLTGGGATSAELTSCTNCPNGKYKSAAGAFDDECTSCAPCDVGSTRTGCALANAGTCTGWNTPTITSVTGTGVTSGTVGGEILDITGKFYGSVRSNSDAADVIVKYGDPSAANQDNWYVATNCQVVTADAGLAADNTPGNFGQIRCLSAPGYGVGHSLSVTIGIGANQRTSATFAAKINYAAPIVALYEGAGANGGSTFGSQTLQVTGANFGPIGTPIDSAKYGEGDYQLDAKSCAVSIAHTEITCQTAPGAGKGLKLVVQIGGQLSTIPAINYGAPELNTKACGSTHGQIVSGEPQCACAKCPNLNSMVPAITIGSQPCWHRTDKANPCTNNLPAPVQSDLDGGSYLSTKGYQLILLSGINFGTKGTSTVPAELESVTYGPYLGTEISMPILRDGTASINPSEAGCKIHEATFSILCNTKPGIAGPHSWLITVKGQTSQKLTTTRYSRPIINTVVPNKFSTSGGDTVVITGDEFGTADTASSFQVIMTDGPNYGCAGTHCYTISATKMATLANGKERVSFPTPAGYGAHWKLTLIVTNSLTSQSVRTFIANSFEIGYNNPEIDGVSIINTGSTFRITVLGSNFCDRGDKNGIREGCANLFLCGGGSNELACTNDGSVMTISVSQSEATSPTSATITHVAGTKALRAGDTVTISGHTGNAANVAMNQEYIVASVTDATHAVLTGSGMTIGVYTSGTISAAVVSPVTVNQVADTHIESWSHTKIVASVGVSTDWLFVKPTGNVLATDKSSNKFFSTTAYTINAGGSFAVNSAGTDIEHTSKIPTAGQASPKLKIHVQNLDVNTGVVVTVNSVDINIVSSDIKLLSAIGAPKLWEISFSAPAGSGSKQTVKVSLGSKSTQNSAFIYYAYPIITDILMPASSSTVCTSLTTECPSIDVTPGILPTEGKEVTIIGSNLGTPTDPNYFMFRWQSNVDAGNYVNDLHYRDSSGYTAGACTEHTHTSIKCTLPPSQGQGYTLFVQIAGQQPTAGAWPGSGRSISYAPPSISSATATPAGLVPANGKTLNPGTITVNGFNFGLIQPTITIGGIPCIVTNKPSGGYHKTFDCTVQDGEGKNLAAVVTAGKQVSSGGATFSYNAPTVSSFTPLTGPTSGLDGNGDAISMTVSGTNFGTPANTELEVILKTLSEDVNVEFKVNAANFTTRTHTQLVFPLPPGFGSSLDVIVKVKGQESAVIAQKFTYIAPTITSISPKCGEYDCYGFKNPGFQLVSDYPKIISITAKAGDVSTVQLSLVKAFPLELDMQVQFQGMDQAKGISTGSKFNYDGTWVVTAIASTTSFDIKSSEKKSSKGVPVVDTYLGFNNPSGNLRALASRSYVAGTSASFNMLETDGCHSRDIQGIRDSGWERYEFYAARLAQSNTASGAGLARQCAFGKQNNTQTIVITGDNFGTGVLNTPLKVTMTQKKCDCSTELDGEALPCMKNDGSRVCVAKSSDGKCPTSTLNCLTDTEMEEPRPLEVKSHSHKMIEVYSIPGFGRHHEVKISVGKGRNAAPKNAGDAVMRYHPPTVTAFETPAAQTGGSTIYRPDGASRITILGYNFGSNNVTDSLEIRIGVEYDTDGSYCGDQEKCMKKCADAQWHSSKEGGDSTTRGFPYIDCIIPQDTAGFKNVSVRIAGQVDNCRTNRKLCGFPLAYPADRRPSNIDEYTNITLLVEQIGNDPNGGLIFTCSRQSETTQSYAKPGELCQEINSDVDKEECEDAACSKPKAKPGFWRLDLDLQFACNEGNNNAPCQADLTGKYKGTSVIDALSSPFKAALSGGGSSDDQICFSGIQDGNNATVCASDKRQCSKRGGAAPGNCIFRRPKEARRAMGKEYWPFACPGTDLGDVYNKDNMDAAKAKCKAANPEAYAFVEALVLPGCPAGRTNHLVDYSVYDKYPALNMSTNCYSVVACNPKSSCLGDNTCALGYEYQKHRCMAWNAKNPNKTSCSSDYDCRTRSGSGADNGLSSACEEGKEEDCSRCKIQTDPVTKKTSGTCECIGGGPRCGLCSRPIGADASADGKEHKGYFRLNDECQECPEHPELIIAGMIFAVIFFCIGAWWMEDKKVNVAFLSIGVDYFQVRLIFFFCLFLKQALLMHGYYYFLN
jgi:hypothetical protein